MLPSSDADKLILNGPYILKLYDSSLKLFTENGDHPTHFNCSLSNVSHVHCAPINVCGSKSGLLMIQTTRLA